MTISPILLIIALLGAVMLGVILCVLVYTLRENSSLRRENSSLSYEVLSLRIRKIPTSLPYYKNDQEKDGKR